MAAGTWTFTNTARTKLLNGQFDIDSDSWKMALFLSTSNIGAASTTYVAGATICITNASTSASIALVNLAGGVHGASDFASIEAGQARYYVTRVGNPTLTFKTASGTATLFVDACARR